MRRALRMNLGKCFILVRSDEIYSGSDCCLPAQADLRERAKIITPSPPERVPFQVSIERVKANPKSFRVRRRHQRLQAGDISSRPIAGVWLASVFHDRPGIVPPTSVVAGCRNLFESRWFAVRKVYSAK